MYELIPEELKKLPNWVVWKAKPDPKSHSGVSKIPINPKTGGQAQSNNPETWTDFETAEKISRDFAGIGFMFENSGYFGVDLDDMPEDLAACAEGDYANTIGEFLTNLDSYTEWSQSGNGIHIICKGRLPEGARRKGKIEMYDSGRFFVMTGNAISDREDVPDRTEEIKPLHQKYLGGSESSDSGQMTLSETSLSVHEIIEKARNSASGAKFESLYQGDISVSRAGLFSVPFRTHQAGISENFIYLSHISSTPECEHITKSNIGF